jgi:hypothetical protein
MAITIPNTFDADTTIVSDEVDENFAEIAAKALDKTGDTITGNIAVSNGITIDGRDLSADLDQAVKTTSEPTFAALTVVGNAAVGGTLTAVDLAATDDLTVGGDILVSTTNKVYLDGGSDTYIQEGATDTLYLVAGGSALEWDASDLRPPNDSAQSLGAISKRWSAVYAANGTIQTSDADLKRDIAPTELGLNFIKELQPKRYRWKRTDEPYRHGLMAQDVVATIDKLGAEFAGVCRPTGKGDGGLNYAEFIAPLIKAVQELSAQVEELKTEVKVLKKV